MLADTRMRISDVYLLPADLNNRIVNAQQSITHSILFYQAYWNICDFFRISAVLREIGERTILKLFSVI